MWSNQPARLILRDGMAPLKVIMVPELTVRLFVHGGKGPAAEDVRFHRPGDEIGQPVPREGLVIPGLRMSEVAGEIRSANLPTRQWRPFRSDELEQIRPGMQEAVVVVGDIPSTWLELGAGIKDDVEGVFCLGDGKRGKKCLLHQGVWRCPCPPGASLGLYGPRWDVGVVRSTESADLLLQTLPEGEPLCLRFPEVRAPGSSVAAQPAGIAGGLLLGGLPRPVQPGEELCFKLPRGEPVDLLLRGPVTGSWTVTAAGQGSAELLSH
jgi:hypothetical protein